MANPKSYLLKEEKVYIYGKHDFVAVDDTGILKVICRYHGKTTGVAKVTTGNIRNITASNYSRDFQFALYLNKRETGKMVVELKNISNAPLKTLVADDAHIQITIEMRGRYFSTEWLPLEKDLVVLRQEISHDIVLDRPYLGRRNDIDIKVSVVAGQKPTFQPETPNTINKKMLEEAIGSDFVIVASSGTEIKCHKSFLCANSDVLRAMIEGSLTEALSRKMQMVDMSDEGVKAFLAFLYCMDITEALSDSGIAYELLHAAHKYNIASLESTMRKLILEKEISWLSVDGSVKLFAFCRDLGDGEELKMKAAHVLKVNAHSLKTSECLKELFNRDTEAAMELFQLCLIP